jgi:uncharacterized OB-fold protein
VNPGAVASRCLACGWQGAPERLWCPSCGSARVRDVRVHGGTVEQVTILRRSAGRGALTVRIGSVRLLGGGVLVARLEPGASAGSPVRLLDDGGAAVARPA